MTWTDTNPELKRFDGLTPQEIGRIVIEDYNYHNPSIETFLHVRNTADRALGETKYYSDMFTLPAWREFWKDSFYIFNTPKEEWGMTEWELFHGIFKALYWQALYT